MTDDITDRLRLAAKPEEVAHVFTLTVVRCSLLRDAADEIERLRADNERLRQVCRRLLPERPSTLGDADDEPPVDDDIVHPVLSGVLGEITEMETTFVGAKEKARRD